MDLKNIKSIHFVGIKGVAMAALAIIAKEMGIKVTGSDVEETFPTDETLKRFGISYNLSFSPQNLPAKVDLVVYTGAHNGIYNPEVQRASMRGIPVLSHAEALGLFMKGKKGVSIAGSHGKTTTSALIAHILMELGNDPSFAIGCGEILSLKTPAHAGKGDFFVAEADEYVTDPASDTTPRFMWQHPKFTVITNVDFDHPDAYKDLESIQEAFIQFINHASEADAIVVINHDNQGTAQIIPKLNRQIVTYGERDDSDYQVQNVNLLQGQTQFELWHHGERLEIYQLVIPGRHNALNAAAAVTLLVQLGFAARDLKKPLAIFSGTRRRFEKVADKKGKLLYDDYAHHPAEIQATLRACRARFPNRRLVAIFQPHTYSRTRVLLSEFALSFTDANAVVITDIYASAREQPIPGLTGETLFQETVRTHPDVFYAPNREAVLKYISKKTRENDLILTMGAGDIYTWLDDIVKIF